MIFDEYFEGQITYLDGDLYRVDNVYDGIDDDGYDYSYIDFYNLLDGEKAYGEEPSDSEIDMSDNKLIKILFGLDTE